MIRLASYKVNVREVHVRALPATGLDGTPFHGAGVDLRNEDARLVIEAASPVMAWLEAREPGVRVRSFSFRLLPLRVLVSVDAVPGTNDRPRALRFEAPWAEELRLAAGAAERLIIEGCTRALLQRRNVQAE